MRRLELVPMVLPNARAQLVGLLQGAEQPECVNPAQAAHAALESLGPIWLRPDDREQILRQLEEQASVLLQRMLG